MPLNNALRAFVTYCDSSPFKALDFAHETREVFRIDKVPWGYGISGPQSGSGLISRQQTAVWGILILVV